MIGPGRIVLVVGPSGAGKDTLLTFARERLRARPEIVFVRRIVTREGSAAEHHDTVTATVFDDRVRTGEFALWWAAHEIRYGLPRAIDEDIAAGRIVVCNASRTIIASARERYADVVAVLVTAPAEVLATRLASRGRESAEARAARLRRRVHLPAQPCDHVIDNSEDIETAGDRLITILTSRDGGCSPPSRT